MFDLAAVQAQAMPKAAGRSQEFFAARLSPASALAGATSRPAPG